MVDSLKVLRVPERSVDILMNGLLGDVIQGCGSDRSGTREGNRKGRGGGQKGIETNEARKWGR